MYRKTLVSLESGHAVLYVPEKITSNDVKDLVDTLKIQFKCYARMVKEKTIFDTINSAKNATP